VSGQFYDRLLKKCLNCSEICGSHPSACRHACKSEYSMCILSFICIVLFAIHIKMHESTLQFRVICYQEELSYAFQKYTKSVSEKLV